jgi:predicted nucleotidyltransferase component of viral defense system
MIPEATIRARAQQEALRPTTVEKDYVLGWVLYGISAHVRLARWVFKGGTCLKKCFFETYRFSEDLDFTVPSDERLTSEMIRSSLHDICDWISQETGIDFPSDRLILEEYTNKQGTTSYEVRLSYVGPLRFVGQRMQRVKFDLTQHELLVDPPDHRAVFHRYTDHIEPAPKVACYSVNEILAEKTRALYERQGRARDVYDVVHISRNSRDEIDPRRALHILRQKFAFKHLPAPTVKDILARIDADVLRRNWNDQLAHQLPLLPPVEAFSAELHEALAWWIEPAAAQPQAMPISAAPDERGLPREHFPAVAAAPLRSGLAVSSTGLALDQLRFAARNRLLAEVVYHGARRTIEPYSLRRKQTGNMLLYVWERTRDEMPTDQVKAYKVPEIESARVLDEPFRPRFAVEL